MDKKLQIGNDEAILIAGPTASGKSRLALELADAFGGEVINADSMQVYGILRVLTARPTPADTATIAHHLYGHVTPGADYSTGIWLAEAEKAIADVRSRGKLPVLAGGTGLYFRALTGGLSDIPEVPEEVRGRLRAMLEEEGVERLYGELRRRDPAMAGRLKPADRQRILRALEVFEATGRSISNFQGKGGRSVIDMGKARGLVLLPDRAELHRRIGNRFAQMVDNGAVEEVRELLSMGLSNQSPAMKAIGVSQLRGVIEGKSTMACAVEAATVATRQYAKRQMTWFRNQLGAGWAVADI